jgi:hypothetical protein
VVVLEDDDEDEEDGAKAEVEVPLMVGWVVRGATTGAALVPATACENVLGARGGFTDDNPPGAVGAAVDLVEEALVVGGARIGMAADPGGRRAKVRKPPDGPYACAGKALALRPVGGRADNPADAMPAKVARSELAGDTLVTWFKRLAGMIYGRVIAVSPDWVVVVGVVPVAVRVEASEIGGKLADVVNARLFDVPAVAPSTLLGLAWTAAVLPLALGVEAAVLLDGRADTEVNPWGLRRLVPAVVAMADRVDDGGLCVGALPAGVRGAGEPSSASSRVSTRRSGDEEAGECATELVDSTRR